MWGGAICDSVTVVSRSTGTECKFLQPQATGIILIVVIVGIIGLEEFISRTALVTLSVLTLW